MAMDSRKRPPTDYRATRKRHERWLLIAAVVVLVVVGGGLIGLVFGPGEMLSALPCLLAGAGLIAGLYFLFVALEWWSQR
jgi:protein-S-isoprenylcysteine O-methyltransferase Ste14